MKQGRTEEAEAAFSRAHELAPHDLKMLAYWSTLQEGRGDLKRAGELLDRAEAVSSADQVSLLQANYLARAGQTEQAFECLPPAASSVGPATWRAGNCTTASAATRQPGRTSSTGKRAWPAKAPVSSTRRMRSTPVHPLRTVLHPREFRPPAAGEGDGPDTPQPIFIVGSPRSGTTLWSSRSCAATRPCRAGGELPFLDDIRKISRAICCRTRQRFPENLAQSWTADRAIHRTLFRDYYLARAEQYGLLKGGKAFFTDKMPFNEVYLPLMKMAFPEAKIVHVCGIHWMCACPCCRTI